MKCIPKKGFFDDIVICSINSCTVLWTLGQRWQHGLTASTRTPVLVTRSDTLVIEVLLGKRKVCHNHRKTDDVGSWELGIVAQARPEQSQCGSLSVYWGWLNLACETKLGTCGSMVEISFCRVCLKIRGMGCWRRTDVMKGRWKYWSVRSLTL